jgi:polyhydroxyalkanoate synthase subunit PhaC
MSVFSQIAENWIDGAIRTLNAARNGFGAVENDPPAVTPYTIIFEGGKVSLRYYAARGSVRHRTPILLTFALIKRPFILDMQKGKSVVEALTNQGFNVYMIDWIPPNESDTWRGFDAYVNGDMADAVRAVQIHSGVEEISLIGYCFGGLLSLIYNALHPENVKNLITITLPLNMSVRDIPSTYFADSMRPRMVESLLAIYGNAPAWMMNQMFVGMTPTYYAIDKYVDQYKNSSRAGYAEANELFEKWLLSDVPLAGQIFRELMTDLAKDNNLFRGFMKVGNETVNLRKIACPVYNMVADDDNIVAPRASVALPKMVASTDARNFHYPIGHMGAAVSGYAMKKLWPEIGNWLKERD